MNLIDRALKAKKPSKQHAQTILRDLADKHPNSVARLAELYAYFMPALPKKPKDDFGWVALAVGKEGSRPYLGYVYVDGGQMVATDGYRMHVADAGEFEPGFYHPVTRERCAVDFKYPEYKRVIPEASRKPREPVDKGCADMGSYGIARKMDDAAFNKRYLDDALAGLELPQWTMQGMKGPCRIDSGNRTAVVMPVRL